MRIGVVMPMAVQPDTEVLPTWPELERFARRAEELGVSSLWVFDHFYDRNVTSETGPIHEAWSVQAALAVVTSRVELGQLVLCSSFRPPGLLAKMAVTVDEMSGGRLTLGLGAGWYDREYRDFGLPTDHRVDRFVEYLDALLPLLRGETVTMPGRYHRLAGAVLSPAPRRRLPVLIAGRGPRMRAVVTRHADAWNTAWYTGVDDDARSRIAEMRDSLAAAGRAASSLRWTVGLVAPAADEAYARAVAGFAALGVDDLIVTTDSAAPACLDRLAAVAAPWLEREQQPGPRRH